MFHDACLSDANVSTIIDILRWRALQHPHQRAYTFISDGEFEEKTLTYAELELRARSIGMQLQNSGCVGMRALLFFPPGLHYLEAFWGCLYAGVVAVPVYQPKLNRSIERIKGIILDMQTTLVLTTPKCFDSLMRWFVDDPLFAHLHWIVTDTISECDHDSLLETEITSDSMAYCQYTSGTTAPPRGVMMSHQNILHNVAFLHRRLSHPTESYMVSWLPPYHDMGLVSSILLPLYAGFPVVLMPPAAFIQRPLRWLEAISRYQAATSGGPNFAYELCVHKATPAQVAALDLSCWSAAFNGSEPINIVTLESFSTTFARSGFQSRAFYPCYGLAEATLFVSGKQRGAPFLVKYFKRSALAVNRVEEVERNDEDACPLVSCGYSAEDQKIEIVNSVSLLRCAPGQVGEIWLAGPSVAQMYWNNRSESALTMQACLADSNEGPFLRTGDLGFFWKGELFVVDRLQDLLTLNGTIYYPQDIELYIQQSHPALRTEKNAVFLNQGQVILVQEVGRHLKQETLEDVLCTIQQVVLKRHGLFIATIVFIKQGSIPKTSSGKIKHFACKEQFLSGTLVVAYK